MKISFLLQALVLFSFVGNAQNPDELYHQFSKAYENLDAQLIANLYSKDADLINLYQNGIPNSFKGRKAILQFFEEFFALAKMDKRALKIRFKIVERRQVGNSILDNGFYHVAVSGPNEKVSESYGKISAVLQKENAEWKFRTDANASASPDAFEQAVSIESTGSLSLSKLSDQEAIRQINRAYLENWIKNDENGVLALFTEDARISPSGMSPIDSLPNIKQFWFPNDGSTTTIHLFDADELSLNIQGPLAFATQKTILEFTYEKDAFKMNRLQKGIDSSIYKKQIDGSWKIWRKSWTDFEIVKR